MIDVNGTLSHRGSVIPGAVDRVRRIATELEVELLTADTFGTARDLGRALGVTVVVVSTGDEKVAHVLALGAESTVAIGNGLNDAPMLRVARLGIAVIGPEGASSAAIAAADIVCGSIADALDLLLDTRLLVATLRT